MIPWFCWSASTSPSFSGHILWNFSHPLSPQEYFVTVCRTCSQSYCSEWTRQLDVWNMKSQNVNKSADTLESWKNISPESVQFKWVILKQTHHQTQFNHFLCIVWEHYHQTTKQRYLPHDFRSNRPRKQRNLCIFVLAVLSCSYYKKSVWVVTWSRNLIWLSSKQSTDTLFSKSWRKKCSFQSFSTRRHFQEIFKGREIFTVV